MNNSVSYLENGDLAVFDGLSFRLDKKTGYYLNSKSHKRLHVYVWEFYNGPVPSGYHVHHIDKDKANNEIENLKVLTADEHLKLHGESLSEERISFLRENLDKTARPAAIEWHKSKEGSEWHKKHYENMKDRLYIRKDFVCQNCGKTFSSTQIKARFCSAKCASAARRKSGVDDIERVCERCGQTYVKNKYQKSRYCKNCLNKVRWETRRLQHGGNGNT